MLKTFFTQGLWLYLLIGLLPSLSYAGVDADGLGTNASDGEDSPCTGSYIAGVRAGSCDSVADCNAFAGCNNTCDFDCDGVQDGVEYPGADPTTPAVALPDTDGDGIFDPCDLDDDGDTVPDQTAPVALTCPNAATYGVPATPDTNPLNANICQDADLDTCDDCAVTAGPPDINNDGADFDADGICDLTDPPPVATTLDVVLTMDRSGSMNGTAAGPVAGTKLAAMQAAASLFVDQIAMDGTHRLGLAQFNAAASNLPGFAFQTLNVGNSGTANMEIGGISATGATNILAGMDTAVSTFVAPAGDRRAVVLFTDGRHNNPSVLADADLTSELLTRLNDGVVPALQFYSIGFGTSISDVPLSDTAAGTAAPNDFHANENDPILLAKGFTQAAVNLLNNVSLSDPLFVLKQGQQDELIVPVSVADRTLTFVVHWDTYDSEQIKTAVIPPSGNCAIKNQSSGPGFQQAMGINYRVVRVTVPFDCGGVRDHAGDWTVSIAYPRQDTVDVAARHNQQRRATERVNIIVYGESGIVLQNQLDLSQHTLNISSRLTAFGTGVEDVSFTAFVTPPLPQTNDSSKNDDLGSNPDGAANIPVPVLAERTPIELTLTGNPVSPTQVDGQGVLKLEDKGVYKVRVVATGRDSRGQAIQREQVSTIYSPGMPPWWCLWWWIIGLMVLCLLIWLYKKKRK